MKRYFLYIIYTIALLAAGSCVRDEAFSAVAAGDGEQTVRIVIDTKRNTPLTRAVNKESLIENVSVLVLYHDAVTSQYTYRYTAQALSGSIVEDAGTGNTTFTVNLRTTTQQVKLLILGNLPTPPTFDEGTPEADLRTQITCPEGSYSSSLPMSGETVLMNGVTSLTTGNIVVPMLRSVARARFAADLDGASKPFVVDEIFVYFANSSVQYIPNPGAMAGTKQEPYVTTASIPSTASNSVVRKTMSNLGAVPAGQIGDTAYASYIPESLPLDLMADPTMEVRMVVGGYFDTDDYKSYYRVDFDSGLEGHPRGQVLRNYDYLFTIKRVTGRGHADADTAADNIATSIVATMIPWREAGSQIFVGKNGSDYIMLDKNEITLDGAATQSGTVVVKSNIPFTFGYNDATYVVGDLNSTTTDGQFSTAKLTQIADNTYTIAITANSTNVDSGLRQETLYIKSSHEWLLEVNVRQLEDTGLPKVNILSAGTDYGSLGDYFDGQVGQAGNADGLKAFLTNTNNFGPDGRVECGGVIMNYVSTSNLTSARLAYYLASADIFVAAYTYNPSDSDCSLIINWLSKPGHVLFCAADVTGTNSTLRARLDPGLVWKAPGTLLGTLVNITGTTAHMADLLNEEVNGEFINGDFGLAEQNTGSTLNDGVYLYVADVPANVTPLIVFANHPLLSSTYNRVGGMLYGVDKARRIVYTGESQMTHTTYWRDAAITVQENTWAWAVRQVLAAQ